MTINLCSGLSEGRIKQHVFNALYAYSLTGVLWFERMNSGKAFYCVQGSSRMKSLHLCSKGCSDFVVFMAGGKTLFLELKTEKGRQSADQKSYQARMEKLGYEYHVVRSVQDVDRVIERALGDKIGGTL